MVWSCLTLNSRHKCDELHHAYEFLIYTQSKGQAKEWCKTPCILPNVYLLNIVEINKSMPHVGWRVDNK